MMGRGSATAVLAVAFTVGACGSSTGVVVTGARMGQPTGPNAALYFTATSAREADRLLGAETDIAVSIALHETTTDEEGTVGMQPVPALDLPAGGSLALEPGGHHLMLVDVSPVEIGDVVDVTIVWEQAGRMTIEAEVVDPADTRSDDG